MKRLLTTLAVMLSLAFASGCSMRNMMVEERVSPYDFERTVAQIQENAKALGWKVPTVSRLDNSIRKHGGPDVLPVAVLKICHPDYAARILSDDDARYVSVMMPCSISVYEKSDGKTYVSNMKAGEVGSMLGGTVAEVMDGPVSGDQEKILEFLN